MILLLDQMSKYYLGRFIALNQSVVVIKNFFQIIHIENKGVAFGLMAQQKVSPYIFIAISFFAIILVTFFIKGLREEEIFLSLGLSLILGGALGNVVDRIRLGAVTDFLDFHWYSCHWPAFNLADSAITLGTILLFIQLVTNREKHTD